MANELVQVVGENEAQVNVTYGGNNGDLAQTVFSESSDADVKAWVTEALRAGSIPGLGAHANADLHDYVVDRHKPTEARPHNLIQIRPKTAYGIANQQMGGVCVCPTCGNKHQGH